MVSKWDLRWRRSWMQRENAKECKKKELASLKNHVAPWTWIKPNEMPSHKTSLLRTLYKKKATKKPEQIQNEQAINIRAACLLFKEGDLSDAYRGIEKWLLIAHASHLDHPSSPYQAWQGSVLCPHLLVWGRNFSSSWNGLRTWEWSYSQPGTGRESTRNPRRKFTSHVHFIWLYVSHQGWQQLVSKFNRQCLNTQTIVPDAP